MRWNEIRDNWDSYLPVITRRWPQADTAVLRPLDTAVINRFCHDSTVVYVKSFV